MGSPQCGNPLNGGQHPHQGVAQPRITVGVARNGRPVDPRGHGARPVQGAEHPDRGTAEFVESRVGVRELVTGCAQCVANDPFGHARNSRRLGAHGEQPPAARPQQRAVGALDDASPRIQNHRLVGTERLRGGAQGGEPFEIGALDGG